MRLSIVFEYKMGTGGHDEQVFLVSDLTKVRNAVHAAVKDYVNELDVLGIIESSPVSIREEVITSVVMIDFSQYADNGIIEEATRRVTTAIEPFVLTGSSGSS